MDDTRVSKAPLASRPAVRRFPLRPHHLVHAITPTPDVFVLSPLGVPEVDVAAWRLHVGGMVERPQSFSFDDIRSFPKQEWQAFHQCAGDPRQPKLPTRRIANVVWGGVELAAVLGPAGVKPDAAFLWAGGLDEGFYGKTPVDSYVKDAPLHDAMKNGILAYELNGAPLDAEHGYPLRFVLPGFYGTNSVKWLGRLELAATRADSLFTTVLYNDPIEPEEPGQPAGSRPVWKVAPESVIVSPAPADRLSGLIHDIWGWAWAHDGIEKVEVSVDGGRSWRLAELARETHHSWQKFRLAWHPEALGNATLMSRATGRDGEAQPEDEARNACYSVAVEIVALT